MNDSLKKLWNKYRYACIVVLVGAAILALPNGSVKRQAQSGVGSEVILPNAEESERRLADTLRNIRGVGTVYVTLSYKTSQEQIYLKDDGQTVLVNEGNGKQEPLEKKTVYPVYLGAVIVCDGAEKASVREQILDAVHQFTGLRSDQISVLPLARST